MIDSWHKYCQKQVRDSFHTLDDKLIFSNTKTDKKDYASKKELFIGCAGGANTTAEFTYQPVSAPQDYVYFRVTVKGLTGGHSGDDINKGRANANKLLNRFLTQLASKYILYLCCLLYTSWQSVLSMPDLYF